MLGLLGAYDTDKQALVWSFNRTTLPISLGSLSKAGDLFNILNTRSVLVTYSFRLYTQVQVSGGVKCPLLYYCPCSRRSLTDLIGGPREP